MLERILDVAAADRGRALPGTPTPDRITVVFLGDLIDRGPGSAEVVARAEAGAPAHGPLSGAQWITLAGNHEDYLVSFLRDISVGPAWVRNGGQATIASYGAALGDDRDYEGLQATLWRVIPAHHLRFLIDLPKCHVEGGYVFVHAGIRPGIPLDHQSALDLMWMREPFISWNRPLERMVVHGHTMVAEPEIHPHRIAIDTGAYRSDRLTCLVLEGEDRRFLTT
ncbi:Diadenosine tetraphosphatase-like protein [Candidatus Terasakiella magnetica]|nr:Diadenosine tetraphosphatase-like protein [Candidatus Terasakiella magnetica]